MLGLLAIPLVLIAFNTVLTTLIEGGTIAEGNELVDFLILLGNTPIALLITLLVAIATLGRRGRTLDETRGLLDQSLGPICSIILVTGAGGMFGGVLRISGIGEALTSSLSDIGIPCCCRRSSSPRPCASPRDRPRSPSRRPPDSSRVRLTR